MSKAKIHKPSERDADKHPAELTIGGGWIAQRAQEKLTEDYSNAYRGCPRTDCGETSAY